MSDYNTQCKTHGNRSKGHEITQCKTHRKSGQKENQCRITRGKGLHKCQIMQFLLYTCVSQSIYKSMLRTLDG